MTTAKVLSTIKGVHNSPLEEYFTSGHRTCQGCESALVMKLMVKAAGPRTIVLGSTGCMHVANTTGRKSINHVPRASTICRAVDVYIVTPWVVKIFAPI